MSRDFGARLVGRNARAPSIKGRAIRFAKSTLRERSARPFTPPIDLSAGRAFGAGLLDVDGDLEHAVRYPPIGPARRWVSPTSCGCFASLRKLAERWRYRAYAKRTFAGRVHSRAATRGDRIPLRPARRAFYRQFLDREMVYSCAYWDEGIDSLDSSSIGETRLYSTQTATAFR